MPDVPFNDADDEALPRSDRLQILSPEEYELLWGFPRFTQSDRDLFFTLTAPEREALEQRRAVRTKIHFLLHLGYCVDIDTLLLFVDRHNGFMEAFEHVLGRYRKAVPSKSAIIASLMAYATNIGLGRMADISNLTYQELSTTAGNFIRLETLKEANDRIANATARLPIFRYFDIDEAVHSSSNRLVPPPRRAGFQPA